MTSPDSYHPDPSRRRFIVRASVLTASAGMAVAPRGARADGTGPAVMLGWVDPDRATLWVQGAADAAVRCVLSGTGTDGFERVDVAALTAADRFTHAFRLDRLAADTTYRWRVLVQRSGATSPTVEGVFRTPSAWTPGTEPAPVTLAFGSCHYLNDGRFDRPGPPYGADYGIFDAIRAQQPDAMLWLGDNVYLREPEWNDAAAAHARYRAHRMQPEAMALWRSVPHAAVWDDHDFGPNDADGTFAGKAMTRDTFRRHWPDAGRGAETIGDTIASRLRLADTELFLLDDRWHRSPERAADGPDKGLLGPAQRDWLETGLAESAANFKVVAMGTQFFDRASRFEAWGRYPTEQRAFLAFLERSRVAGVVFLSGDRHFGELLRIERPGLYPLYECTSSPLTAGFVSPTVLDAAERENPDLVPGTLVTRRQFGVLRAVGPLASRRLVFEARASDGATLWSHTVPLHALQPFDPR